MHQKFNAYIDDATESLNQAMNGAPRHKRLHDVSTVSLPQLFALLSAKHTSNGARYDNAMIDRFANNVFSRGMKPSAIVPNGGNTSGKTAEELLTAVAKAKGINVKPEEAAEIVRLLETGEFFGDISDGTAAVLYCIPRLPVAVMSDIKEGLSPKILAAVFKDVAGIANPASLPAILADLADGTFDHPPKVMTHTLKELYRRATVRSGLDTIHSLYAKNNRSVRLTTILYARANGVDLTEKDIDAALSGPLNPTAPDLGPALVQVYEKYAKKN